MKRILLSSLLVVFTTFLYAEEAVITTEETSTFKNEAEAMRAEQIAQNTQEGSMEDIADVNQAVLEAEETVTQIEKKIVIVEDRLTYIEGTVEDAEQVIANEESTELQTQVAQKVISLGIINITTLHNILDETQIALAQAKETLQDAQDARDGLSMTSDSIATMRDDGMGWGEIAHTLGIHPSALGLGHLKKAQNMERVRAVKSFKNLHAKANSGNSNGYGLSGKATKDKGNRAGGKSPSKSRKGNSKYKDKLSNKGNFSNSGKAKGRLSNNGKAKGNSSNNGKAIGKSKDKS